MGFPSHQAPLEEGLEVLRDINLEHLNSWDQLLTKRSGDVYIPVLVGPQLDGFQPVYKGLPSSCALQFRALICVLEITTRALSAKLHALRRMDSLLLLIGATVNA